MSSQTINPVDDLEVRKRLGMLLTDISSRLTNLPPEDVDQELSDAQRRICDLLALDISAVWQWLPEHQGLFTITHLYRRFEGPPVPEPFIASDYFPWLHRQLTAGKSVAFSSLAEFPPEAARDRESIEYYGMKTVLMLPIWIGAGPPLGLVSFHSVLNEHAWPAELVNLLQQAAKIFANALGRKRSDEILSEDEDRLSLAAEASEAGLWVFDYNAGVFWLTDRTRAIFGYRPEELVTMERFEASVVPEDLELVRRTIEHAKHSIALESVEYRIAPGDGKLRWINSRGRCYFGATGKPKRLMGVSIDITDRKRVEEALRISEARLASGVELAGLGFYEVAIAQGVIYIDDLARTLFGFAPGRDRGEEAIAFWMEHIHQDDRPRVLDSRLHLHDGRMERISTEYRYLHPDGGQKWLSHVVAVTRRDSSGLAVQTVGVVRDITPEKEAEAALRQSYSEVERLKDRLKAESDYLKAEISQTLEHDQIIGNSVAIKKVLQQVQQVAPTDSSVLICGETGTGKELVAQAVHRLGLRKSNTMIKVSCAALPVGLVESELFGREKGAFTGALTRQVGRFEIADQSTLFLDEVAELPPEVQVKLLRVLQEGEFERLGSSKTIKVNVRIIAATNRDLTEEIKKGRFREDLYYRLSVFPIRVPALRDRPEDIPLLVWAFLGEFCARMGKKITQVSRKTMETLQCYPWPGNVRQLRNVIEHGAILSTGSTLVVPALDEKVPGIAFLPQSLAEAEREHVVKTLEKTGWRIKGPNGAAALLGLKPSSLYTRMRKLGIPNRNQKKHGF